MVELMVHAVYSEIFWPGEYFKLTIPSELVLYMMVFAMLVQITMLPQYKSSLIDKLLNDVTTLKLVHDRQS